MAKFRQARQLAEHLSWALALLDNVTEHLELAKQICAELQLKRDYSNVLQMLSKVRSVVDDDLSRLQEKIVSVE